MDLPIIERAKLHGESIAYSASAVSTTYAQLLDDSARLAGYLLKSRNDLREARVGMLVPPGADYSTVQWGIWRAGGVMLPLCLSATEQEWEYSLSDSEVEVLVTTEDWIDKVIPVCQRLGVRVVSLNAALKAPTASLELPSIDESRRAMILYTSGTTSKPKGVVTTHSNIQSQIKALVEAWGWSKEDRIPLFLPLHHIHGIINIMGCALWSGATIEPFSRFDMASILERVQIQAYTLFMAVPTIYVKLIEELAICQEPKRREIISGFAQMRLMVSGSAALPVSVFDGWYQLTGQKLLERYGMTEIGMALSNPYRGERLAGTVGQPLPNVEVRLKDGEKIIREENVPGEIQVRGPSVFQEYWNRSDITVESFDDGWFRTGDIAVIENGYYRIMGRSSVDIIKSGGYKLSALEIESVLLDHPAIRECAVLGIEDNTWGEAVAVAVTLHQDKSLDIESLREWCRQRMSVYKIPKYLKVTDSLPRNAMGKVTKPAVRQFFDDL
jgi:malonyl-CoA/methylmalonyl-CoA synthetase